MRQIIIDFGQSFLPIRIYGYGLMLVLGVLTSIFVGRYRARRFGENPDTVTTIGLLSLGGGVIGARVAYVIERWNSHFAWQSDPWWEMFNITSGGLIYYGGVLLAVLLVVAYLLAKRLPARRYLDIIAPTLMIGLAFGRMGCFLNGCCYGGLAKDRFPLAISFPYASTPLLSLGTQKNIFGASSISPTYSHQVDAGILTPPPWLQSGQGVIRQPSQLTAPEAHEAAELRCEPVLPSQLLEMFSALLLAGILLIFSRFRRREGQVFAMMLMLYPPVRFVMEMIRGDNLHDLLALQLTHNQYSSLLMVSVGAIVFVLLRKLPASCGMSAMERLGTKHPKNSVARASRP